MWNSTFAGDTWEGSNLIPNAIFQNGVLTLDVKMYEPPQSFPTIDLPSFYYRSGNVMAMALSADALVAQVEAAGQESASVEPGGGTTQDLLYRGTSDDFFAQAELLAVLATILATSWTHIAALLFTAGFIFLLSGHLPLIAIATVLLTNLTLLTPAPPTAQPEPAATPDPDPPAPDPGPATATGDVETTDPTPPAVNVDPGGSGLFLILILVGLILLFIGLGLTIIKLRRRSKPEAQSPETPGGTTKMIVDDELEMATNTGIPVSSVEDDDELIRPVIFVPGIMASAIQANTDHGPEILWPPLGYNFDLKQCLETLQGTDPSRLSVNYAIAGGLLPGIHLRLLGFLESHGYRQSPGNGLEENLYIHAYNWLESCSVAAAGLVKLITRVTAQHGVPPSIIAHSMGGLVTRAALNDGTVEVDKVFYDASPHLGAPMAYYSIHPDIPYKFLPGAAGVGLNAAYATATSGSDSDIQSAAADSWQVTKYLRGMAQTAEKGIEAAAHALGGSNAFDAQMKLISQNATGVFELLPDEMYFEHLNKQWPVVTHKKRWYRQHGSYERRDYVPSTAAEAYRSDNAKDLPALPTHLAGKIEAALAFKSSISNPLPPGGEGRTFVVYGAEHDTVCEAVMTDDGSANERGDIECTIGGDQKGDGTVPTESGRGEPLWGAGVIVERDNTAEHFMMTETPRFHGILSQYLPRGGR